MERNDIIKALECCASPNFICGECPIDQKIKEDCVCGQFVSQKALSLIKQLTEENKRLKEKADRFHDNLKAVLDERAEAKTDVAREIFEDIEKHIQEKKKAISMFKDGEDDFYDGEIHALEVFAHLLTLLKKKYIGD